MKIHFISSSLFGAGAQRVLVILANHFVTKGHDVSIITFNDGDAYYIDERVKRVRLHSSFISNHTLRSLGGLVSYYLHKSNRPDIAISFLTKTNFISILACKVFQIKIIVSEHSNHLRKGTRISHFTWNHLYKLANKLTILTSFDKAFFEEKGVDVVVMPNPTTFIPIINNDFVRKKVIIAAGSLNRYYGKGFDNLISLIAPVLKKYPEWVLKFVGKGDDGVATLKELAYDNGIADQVIFTGFRDDVNLILKESEIFVLSSRFEGLPMVLLEAMSQGAACISYDCITGPSEMIVDEQNGLLIEDQNMQAMQDGLVRLIENEPLRRRLGLNAINSLEKYSIENVYKLWEGIFKEIV